MGGGGGRSLVVALPKVDPDWLVWIQSVKRPRYGFARGSRTGHYTLFMIAVRRIHSTHRVPKTLRNIATRRLAAMVRPIR